MGFPALQPAGAPVRDATFCSNLDDAFPASASAAQACPVVSTDQSRARWLRQRARLVIVCHRAVFVTFSAGGWILAPAEDTRRREPTRRERWADGLTSSSSYTRAHTHPHTAVAAWDSSINGRICLHCGHAWHELHPLRRGSRPHHTLIPASTMTSQLRFCFLILVRLAEPGPPSISTSSGPSPAPASQDLSLAGAPVGHEYDVEAAIEGVDLNGFAN